MLLVQILGRKVVGEDLSLFSPLRIHLMQSDMVTSCQEIPYVCVWSVRVDVALLVEQVVNSLPVAQHNDIHRAKFEREDRSILLCPYAKPFRKNA